MDEEIITFLVENNEEILFKISDYVLDSLNNSDETLEEIVLEALKEVVLENFSLNYIDIYDILHDERIYKEPFYSLYFREELYIKNNEILH